MTNLNVLNSLSQAQRSADLYAQLYDSATGEVLFDFLLNPEELSFTQTALYTEVPTAGANVPGREYQHTTAPSLSLSNVLVDTYSARRSASTLIATLQSLLESREDGMKPPRRVTFVWGSRTYGPAVLTELSWQETLWLSGEPAQLRLNLVFERVPETQVAPTASTTQPPPTSLTPRQVGEGRNQGQAWLQDNLVSLNPQAKSVVAARRSNLQVDDTTGTITLKTAAGTLLGCVGRWDGRQFIPSTELLS